MGIQTPNRPGFGSRPMVPGLNAGGALRRIPGQVLTPEAGAGVIFGGRRPGPGTGSFSGVATRPTGPGRSPINPGDLDLPSRGPSPGPSSGPGGSPIDRPSPQRPANPGSTGPGNVSITVNTPGGPSHGGSPVDIPDGRENNPQGSPPADPGPFKTPPIQPTTAPPAPQPQPAAPPAGGLNPFVQGNSPAQGTAGLGLWNNPFLRVGLDRLFNRGF